MMLSFVANPANTLINIVQNQMWQSLSNAISEYFIIFASLLQCSKGEMFKMIPDTATFLFGLEKNWEFQEKWKVWEIHLKFGIIKDKSCYLLSHL